MGVDISRKDIEKFINIVNEQSKRIESLEKEVRILKTKKTTYQEVEEVPEEKPSKKEKSKPEKEWNISPTTIITTIGIIGVVISLVSFFMYAIANKWIGPSGQISIGVILGLILFIIGFKLYDKHQKWSITTYGGAIFIEFLSIGFGVWYYGIINEIFAFVLLLIFLVIGILLSIKYDSLILAYFAIIGGFVTPQISKMYTSPLFTILFLLILSIGVLFLSKNKNWPSLRLVSYLYLIGYEFYIYSSFGNNYYNKLSPELSIFFIILFFLIFNISSIMLSVRKDEKISMLDVVLLNLNTFITGILLETTFFNGTVEIISEKTFGLILLVFSFIFLFEVYFIKKEFSKNNNIKPTIYSLYTSGIILVNIGLILVFNDNNIWNNLAILLIPQWALYSYLSKKPNDSNFYRVFEYIFLGVTLIWWIIHIYTPYSPTDSALIIIYMTAFILILTYFVMKGVNEKVNSFVLVCLAYFYFYSLMKYVQDASNMDSNIATTILSVLWLGYTLTLYIKTRGDEHHKVTKVLSLIFLTITLLKIAFMDLTRLDGVVRIVAFMVLGILLLIGGYILKK